jgi:DNA-binding CsgD family transcriptional regulator
LTGTAAQFAAVAAEAEAAHDEVWKVDGLVYQAIVLAYQGETAAAGAVADAAVAAGSELSGIKVGGAYRARAVVALAAGDVATAQEAVEMAWEHFSALPLSATLARATKAQAALASGDLVTARQCADDAVSIMTGKIMLEDALTTRCRVAIAQGELEQAERAGHDALAHAAEVRTYLFIPDILECLGTLAGEVGSHREAARLFGATAAMRERFTSARFKIYDPGYEAALAALRDAMDESDFDAAWAEGAALSTEEAIAYAQRGRGERKRPASGWAALTPTERQVVQLVSEGLTNNDIATRLFVSPRTVQTHLTHVYTKLGLASRVQLAQEAARRA